MTRRDVASAKFSSVASGGNRPDSNSAKSNPNQAAMGWPSPYRVGDSAAVVKFK
jgi:hypothetical protein